MPKNKNVDYSIFEKGSDKPDEEKVIFDALRDGIISKEDAIVAMNRVVNQSTAMDAFKRLTDFSGPKIHVPKIPKIQMEKIHDYASAKILLKSLNRYYKDWSSTIGKDHQVAIYVILANGAMIRVNSLIEEGYNGIAIEGELEGSPCLLLLQQSNLQFICVGERLEPSHPKRNIGFIFAE